MKLIIRDDDVSYFTDPKHLEHLYKDIWDKVPIHLAVIPDIVPQGPVAPIEEQCYIHHDIEGNKELVKFIKKKIKQGKVKIWQHGYDHEDLGGKHECEREGINIKEGKRQLTKLFNTKIKIFVAPHDRFSKKAVKVVESCKMDICRGFSPLPREFMFRHKYFTNFLTHLIFWLKYKTKFRIPIWLDFGKHKELYSYRINHITYKNIDDIIERHKDGILCITVHHRSLSLEGIEKIKYILRRMKDGRKKIHI